uniref:Uncharacterized protein n=1 Tax=Cannabis sativa TaxID=3483 RepID=A0A803QCY7_CANSA
MSFLAAMVNCSKRKTTILKLTVASAREVMHGILVSSSNPTKNKSQKRGKTVEASPLIKDSSKGKLKFTEVGEGSPAIPIEISRKKAKNIHLRKLVSSNPQHVIAQRCFIDIVGVADLEEAISDLESSVSNLQGVTDNEKSYEERFKKDLPTSRKRTFEFEDSFQQSLDDKTLSVAQLEGQLKRREIQVTKLEETKIIGVVFYDGLCFDAIYHAWSANGGA